MNYLWQEFNIKTFPAETVVFRDGVFVPELSTLESCVIDEKYDLPVHIIYIGEIAGDNILEIDISAEGQPVFLTTKIQNKKPAFLNILVKNAGKKSVFKGKVLAQNYSTLTINNTGRHLAPETGIEIETKLVAHANSVSKLIGSAEIEKGCVACDSNIGFRALADSSARIEFAPRQFIRAVPLSAGHNASIFKGDDQQVEYLRTAGLAGAEVKTALEEAFMNDFDLF
jgi:hypothetical protein